MIDRQTAVSYIPQRYERSRAILRIVWDAGSEGIDISTLVRRLFGEYTQRNRRRMYGALSTIRHQLTITDAPFSVRTEGRRLRLTFERQRDTLDESKETKTTTVMMHPRHLVAIARMAQERGITQGHVVREIIEEWYEESRDPDLPEGRVSDDPPAVS